jgi:hypothetical protein
MLLDAEYDFDREVIAFGCRSCQLQYNITMQQLRQLTKRYEAYEEQRIKGVRRAYKTGACYSRRAQGRATEASKEEEGSQF